MINGNETVLYVIEYIIKLTKDKLTIEINIHIKYFTAFHNQLARISLKNSFIGFLPNGKPNAKGTIRKKNEI